MKKKLLLLFLSACLFGSKLMAQDEIPLGIEWGDGKPIHHGGAKSPVQPPTVSYEGNSIYLASSYSDFTLRLLDADGVVAYETFVPAGTATVVLPSTLSGDYELRLVTSTFYFYGYITLEEHIF